MSCADGSDATPADRARGPAAGDVQPIDRGVTSCSLTKIDDPTPVRVTLPSFRRSCRRSSPAGHRDVLVVVAIATLTVPLSAAWVSAYAMLWNGLDAAPALTTSAPEVDTTPVASTLGTCTS